MLPDSNYYKNIHLQNEKQALLRKKAEEVLSKKANTPIEFSREKAESLIHELQVHQIELQMQNDELRLTHHELEKSIQRYLTLYNKAPVGYFELDSDFIIQEVNDTALKLLDMDYSDVEDSSIEKFIFKADQDIFYLFRKKITTLNAQHSCELRMTKNDGSYFWVLMQVYMDHNDDLNNIFRLSFHDISDKKKYELELHEKEDVLIAQSRQAAMGDMVAMIAHQWRQPITNIGMTANNMKIDIALNHDITSKELEDYANEVQGQVKYLSQTIDDFRDFLKVDLKKENASICDIMDTTLSIIGKSLENHNIKVEREFTCIGNIDVVKNELNQVFINLINNAKDSLLESNIKKPMIFLKIYEDKDFINIKIKDNGNGIPAEILPKLGEPYVSSKSQNGTGIGIYMSKIIIEKHMNGILKWENLDKGACFTIILNK